MPSQITVNSHPYDTSVVRVLDLHADFACGNCGLCCGSGWAIHVMETERRQMEVHFKKAGWTQDEIDRHFYYNPKAPIKNSLAYAKSGYCIFHGCDNGTSCCLFQRAYGHKDLPGVCQSFPRTVIATPGGVFITLSYTCPTAARLLLEKDRLRDATSRSTLRPEMNLMGVAFRPGQKPPTLSDQCRPDWQTFEYFWRWTPEWVSNPILTPAESLYGLGTVIEAIEAIGPQASSLEVMIDVLDQALKVIPPTVKAQAAQKTPQTQLGVIYLETLINVMRQTNSFKKVFKDLCDQPQFRPELFRHALAAEYDRIVRPVLPEYELIERNYVASRLFAFPPAWLVKQLRTGYFCSVLSLIALRFSVLAICLLEGRAPDQEVWLRAADNADFIMLHSPLVQTRFMNLLEENIKGNIRDLAAPALF